MSYRPGLIFISLAALCAVWPMFDPHGFFFLVGAILSAALLLLIGTVCLIIAAAR